MDLERGSTGAGEGKLVGKAQLNSEVVSKIMSLYVSVPNIEAFKHLSISRNSAEKCSRTRMAADYGLNPLRFYTEELRSHLKSGNFPTMAEVG